MRNITSAFQRALAADRRNYLLEVKITLTDSTVLTVNNDQIWENGFSIEDAVSADNVFQVGGAIINKATVILNNIYDEFSAYDFTDAKVVMSVGLDDLDDGTDETVKMGTFYVDEATYNGALITLSCLDVMARFDRPYCKPTDTGALRYPATLGEIVRHACETCGVPLATNSQQFNRYTYAVIAAPSSESTTYRQVISWAAQIAGSFARCNVNGELEIKWYNMSALDEFQESLDGGHFDSSTPYSSGDSADGGSFNPWNTGDVYDGGSFQDQNAYHFISSSYSNNLSVDDVVITGVRVVKRVVSEGTSDAFVQYMSGTEGYIISVEDNDLIQGAHGQDIANALGTEMIGARFRKADITHLNDPSIEAGDVAVFWDRKENWYPIVISSTTFTAGNSQHTVSSAETPARNSAQRFSVATKNYVDFRRQLEQVRYGLSERLDEAGGLYATYVTEQGATKIYYHDKPNLSDSSIVMLFSTTGFTLTANYQDENPTWYGMTVDGQMIASIMDTIGINFDWGVGGELVIKNAANVETLYANANTGEVRIIAQNIPNQWFGSGLPTLLNYPASQWTTNALKNAHLNDLYYDSLTEKAYKFTQLYAGSVIKFSDLCATGAIDRDYVQVYFQLNNEWYAFGEIGGNGQTNTIAGAEFFIPSTQYVLYWKTYGFVYSFYGWAIESVTSASLPFPDTASKVTGLPSATSIIQSQTPTPQSSHNPYEPGLSQLIYVTTGNTGGTASYAWVEALGVSAEEIQDALDQESVFNALTNNGAAQGIYLQNGQLYISFSYAKGGTLKLGGSNNVYGVLELDATNAGGGYYEKYVLDSYGFKIFDASNNLKANLFGESLFLSDPDVGYGITMRVADYLMHDWTLYPDYPVEVPLSISSYSYGEIGFGVVDGDGYIRGFYVTSNGDVVCTENFTVKGTKARSITNREYGSTSLYAYETATPYFGDIGTGQIGESGETIISIEDQFERTVNTNVEYSVFLQKEGPGDIWVSEKNNTYFAVSGTPGLKFSWELKCVQRGYEDYRLDDFTISDSDVEFDNLERLLDNELRELDNEILFDE